MLVIFNPINNETRHKKKSVLFCARNHSLKSANETKFWLCLLRDAKRAEPEETNKLLKEAEELSKILGASLLTLRGKK